VGNTSESRSSMTKIIDYIFYRISNIYIEKYRDKQGYIYGAGIIILMELMHVYAILLIAAIACNDFDNWFFEPSKNVSYLYEWKNILIIILLLLSGVHLNENRYYRLKATLMQEDEKVRNKKGWLIGIYIIANIGLTMYLAIYRSHLH
jgi:hypothetical protein